MKKKIISTILALSLLITPLISYGEEALAKDIKTTLSLEQAIEEGIKNSQELTINELEIEVKKTEYSEARYRERKYDKSGYSLGTVEGFLLDENMLSKQANYALEEEKLKTEYIREDIKYNVTNAYYGVLQAKDYVNVAKSTLENIKRNHDIIAKKFELGMASKSDVLMSEIALNEGYTNLEKAKEDLERASRALNMVLNYPLDAKIELTSGFKEQEFNRNIDEDIERSYTKRFDIIQLNNNYDLVKLDFDTNAKVYTPNTFIYKYKEINVKKMEDLLHNAKQNIEFDIRTKYDGIKSAEKQIQLAKANVEKAEEGLRLRELAYKAGTGVILEVKEAITQLYNAKLALSNAIANYNLKILEYDKAVNIGSIR